MKFALVETRRAAPIAVAAVEVMLTSGERSLRGIAIGRNNWTFVGSDRGGRTMAVWRSFVTSCELAKVDPFAWCQDVLSRIGSHSIQQLDELLPPTART
jgi:hypothetical protein